MIDELNEGLREVCMMMSYLLLSTEKRISDKDLELWVTIGEAYIEDFNDFKGKIIGDCENLLTTKIENKNRYDKINEIIMFGAESGGILYNRITLFFMVLFYNNSESKSNSKLEIINSFMNKSGIDNSFLAKLQEISMLTQDMKLTDESINFLEKIKSVY